MKRSAFATLLCLLAPPALAVAVARADAPVRPTAAAPEAAPAATAPAPAAAPAFRTAGTCLGCHNGLAAPDGEDVSFGHRWRSSMMANSARDPYWQAAVRREVLDHPGARAAIEEECSRCHMPMANLAARAAGRTGQVFAHLDPAGRAAPAGIAAADGVSCTVCHQITPERLGTPESFVGGFVVAAGPPPPGGAPIFGRRQVERGLVRVMRSATSFAPTEAAHLQTSEMCATCHTLYTHALGPDGQDLGRLPEQVPYLEWKHSAYDGERGCPSCHMPTPAGPTAIANVLGPPRDDLAVHEFRGGNFVVPRLLNALRAPLGTVALPQELDLAVRAVTDHLRTEAAALTIGRLEVVEGRLRAEVTVENQAGHKLPTAYPSRRAWLHVTIRDARGQVLLESGTLGRDGAIAGNDNDADPLRHEPHHLEIDSPDEVQVYEAILGDPDGRVTTGLLAAVSYLKDNRLLPLGFDKATAAADVAVRGEAAADEDFAAGTDVVRYVAEVAGAAAPFEVRAELLYQPIGFRWAENLRPVDSAETRRFVTAFDPLRASSAVVLARASSRLAPAPAAAATP